MKNCCSHCSGLEEVKMSPADRVEAVVPAHTLNWGQIHLFIEPLLIVLLALQPTSQGLALLLRRPTCFPIFTL